ncbi:MAG: 4,5-dioxygenase [Nostoc sp. TH1S01]|nr:4,5-dioxygenase [Nostoc sp. TH1S01]
MIKNNSDKTIKESSSIIGFHAHIYYDPETRDVAAKIREELGVRFEVILGRWRDQPVGPHPKSMYQVAFAPEQFSQVVPWLMLNRGDLDILVHPETGDDVTDHTAHALWLGNKLELNIQVLQQLL